MFFFLAFFSLFVMIFARMFMQIGFIDGNDQDKSYKNFLERYLPRLHYSTIITIVIGFVFGICYLLMPYEELDFFYDIGLKNIFIVTVFFIILIIPIKEYFSDEITKVEKTYTKDEIKKKNPYLYTSINIFIFAASLVFAIESVSFTNIVFDFSSPEENYFKVSRLEHSEKDGKNGKIHSYYIYITPSFGNNNFLSTDRRFFNKLKEGDKIKVISYKGLYRNRYYEKNYQLVK